MNFLRQTKVSDDVIHAHICFVYVYIYKDGLQVTKKLNLFADIITTPEMLDFQCIIMNILKTSFLTPSSSNSSNTNTNISSTASSFVLLDSLMAVINKSDPTEIHSKNTSHDDCHDSEIGGDSSLDVGILPIDMWTLYALYGRYLSVV